jgi:exosortase
VRPAEQSPPEGNAFQRWASVGVLVAATLWAYRGALFLQPRLEVNNSVEAWFFQAGDTSPQLAYAVFAWIVWNRRVWIGKAAHQRGLPALGLPLLALGLALYGWAFFLTQIDLYFESFVLCLMGGALAVGGRRLATAFVLPLAIVWLARPLPPIFVHEVHNWLQAGTSWIAFNVVSAFGPAGQTGDLIVFSGRVFEVVETCSGLRIIQTMIMASLVYTELFRRRRYRAWAVIAIAPILAFLVNGLRVVSLIANPWSEVDVVHSAQGIAMLVLGVFSLAVVDSFAGFLLRNRPVTEGYAARIPADLETPPTGSAGLPWYVPAVAAGAALFSVIVTPLAAYHPMRDRIIRVPGKFDEWKAKPLTQDRSYLGSVKWAHSIYRDYGRSGDQVELFLGVNDRRRRDISGVSDKTRLAGKGWEVVSMDTVAADGIEVERIVSRKGKHSSHLGYHWRYGTESIPRETFRWMLALDMNPRLEPLPIVSVRVETEIGPDGEAGAEARLDRFLAAFAPILRGRLPPELLPESQRLNGDAS